VDLAVAQGIVDQLNAIDAAMRAVQLRPMGGASARVPADATAYAHRSSKIMVNVAAFHDGTPEDLARKSAWVDGTCEVLYQGDDAEYVNFVADEGPEGVRRAYPGATYDRLAAIKRRYDPDNLFRLNQNIPPAEG
jgi:FAD/FMN-containing dehydrogenase